MDLNKRKNHRLKNYDYSNSGYYYITICTKKMKCLLCTIDASTEKNSIEEKSLRNLFNNPLTLAGNSRPFVKVSPTPIGKIVTEAICNIEKLNADVKIDKFALMPNHIHVIVVLTNSDTNYNFEKDYDFQIRKNSISELIRSFKSVTTRKYKKLFNTDEGLWQESFYDEILKSPNHYENVWQYIEENPANWISDKLNPDNINWSIL